ncbi:MAG: hypothetical protein M3063_05865 [Actinomycetota bacterium]|nr:hypothetical protein [Actinomycetota bacterium]
MAAFEDVADELARLAEAGPAEILSVVAAAPVAVGLPVLPLDALFPHHPVLLSDLDQRSDRTRTGISDFFDSLSVRPDLLGWNTHPLGCDQWLQLTSVGRLGLARAGLVAAILCPSGELPDVILAAPAGPDRPGAPQYWLRAFVHAGQAVGLGSAMEAKVLALHSILLERLGVYPST